MRLLQAGRAHSVVLAVLAIMVVGCPDARVQLKANTDTLDFGATAEEMTVSIVKERSSRQMSPLVATTAQEWIEIIGCASAADGCVSDGPLDPITVTIRVDRSRMAVGNNVGTVVFSSQGAVAETVTVRASTVVAPAFSADNQNPFEDVDRVTFTDMTEVQPGWTIESYRWDFGQGGRSNTATPPAQEYSNPGEYDVSLTVTVVRDDERVTVTATRENFIVVSARVEPVAMFTISNPEPLANAPVFFMDMSTAGTAPISNWAWDFDGNGTIDSRVQNPTHTYTTGGEFTVILRVTTPHGIATAEQIVRVVVRAPVADFRVLTPNPAANIPVRFEDLSIPGTSPIVRWEWDFGDGGTDTRRNPEHTFTDAGTFTVTLRVVDAVGQEDEIVREGVVTVTTAAPIADFGVSRQRVTGSQPITFIDRSDLTTSPPPDGTLPRYEWRFYNNETGALITQETRQGSQDPNITIDFTDLGFTSGLIDAELTVTTAHGTDSLRRDAFVFVTPMNALDEYIFSPESCSAFDIRNTINDPQPDPVTGPRFVANVLLVTSQAWRTNQPCATLPDGHAALWQHWVTIIDPTNVDNDTALLVLDDAPFSLTQPPTTVDPNLVSLALSTRSVVAVISSVPKQPILVNGDLLLGRDLVAATLEQFLDSAPADGPLPEADQPILFPMAKSAVSGMTAVQDFLDSIAGVEVTGFVLLGEDNLAWAAWLAAATDPEDRVRGIAPVVFDFLNVNAQIEHQVDTLGFFSEVWEPYIERGLFGTDGSEEGFFNRFDSPMGEALLALVDPNAYADRYLGAAKLIINAAGDQFFPPDSSQFYFNANPALQPTGFDAPIAVPGLRGEKKLAYIPGVDHAFGGVTELAERFVGWYDTVIDEEPLPQFDWVVQRTTDGPDQIVMTPEEPPSRVMMYRAFNSRGRDFRLDSDLNPANPLPMWTSQQLNPNAAGQFIGLITPNRNQPGWFAFFLQVEYDREDDDGNPGTPLTFTTDVVITPDTLGPPVLEGDPVPPIANFTVVSRVVAVNEPVQFTDTSIPNTAPITLWEWDFGDGTPIDNRRNPVHTYTTPGSYDVSLTVTTEDGMDTEFRANFITAQTQPAVAAFEASSRRPLVGDTVEFTDASNPGSTEIIAWAWEFRNAMGGLIAQSALQNPSVMFTQAGAVTVSLEITTSDAMMDSITVVGFVNVFTPTALDDYMDNGDPFDFTAVHEFQGPNGAYTATVLDLASQTWRSVADVTRTLWNHWVTIVRPAVVDHSTALLMVSGGNYDDEMPMSVPPELAAIATASNTVVAIVSAVPNQPLRFTDDPPGVTRSEDAIIAFTFRQFLDSFNPDTGQADDEWPALLPMTKAAVRTMDATQMFLGDQGIVIDDFIVSGASKRGWTTWLTAAADDRVVGIAPLVYDALNFVPQIEHHFDTYGTFSPAVQDYVNEGIFFSSGSTFVNRFAEPGAGPALTRIVDPYEYRGRFALMPKLLINSTGDQFFVPDSAQLYFNPNPSLDIAGFDAPLNIDGLQGERKLAYIENTDHGLNRPERVVEVFLGWYLAVLEERSLPNFIWEVRRNDPPTTPDQILVNVPAGETLTRATLWRAISPIQRDFRFDETGSGTGTPMWSVVTDLTPIGTEIVADLTLDSTAPSRLQAFFVELEFADAVTGVPQFYTTEVVITPDELPALN